MMNHCPCAQDIRDANAALPAHQQRDLSFRLLWEDLDHLCGACALEY
jgi:hypothetical protein